MKIAELFLRPILLLGDIILSQLTMANRYLSRILHVFVDFAVGAPYAGKDGNGVIYVYHGSASGVRNKPSQVNLRNKPKMDC